MSDNTNSGLFAGTSRRDFIKTYAQLGVYFGLCAPLSRYFVGEAQAQTANLSGTFRADLSVAPFTALQNLNGSVRVEVPNGSGITALAGATPSIIITRVSLSGSSQFGALGQRCTHEGFAVNAKSAASPNLICSSGHGGSYNPATGAVVTSPPPAALTSYSHAFNNNVAPGVLDITIPGIGYTFAHAQVSTTQGNRIRLTFPSRSGSNYGLRFRSAVTGSQSNLSFFTVPNGTVATSNIAGTGSNLSIYVNPPQEIGFYQIVALP